MRVSFWAAHGIRVNPNKLKLTAMHETHKRKGRMDGKYGFIMMILRRGCAPSREIDCHQRQNFATADTLYSKSVKSTGGDCLIRVR
jgi:hypothetical protein